MTRRNTRKNPGNVSENYSREFNIFQDIVDKYTPAKGVAFYGVSVEDMTETEAKAMLVYSSIQGVRACQKIDKAVQVLRGLDGRHD